MFIGLKKNKNKIRNFTFNDQRKKKNTSLHPFNINVMSRQLTLERDYRSFRDFLVFQFPENGYWWLWGGDKVCLVRQKTWQVGVTWIIQQCEGKLEPDGKQ